MSRRNKYYDDDDLEDYSDEDYSDEGEYDNRKGGSSPKRVEVDDEEEPEDFVQYIRDRLDKTPLINNETIITQLEKHNYNVKSALTAVKNLQKQQQLKSKPVPNSTKPPSKTAPKAAETKAVSSIAKKNPSAQQTTIPTNTPSSTVFTKAQETLSIPNVQDTIDEDLSASLQQICMSDDDLSIDFTAPSPLPEVTLIVAGHVDSGKSTLVGHLLHKLGKVTSRTIAQHQRDSSAMGKGSFSLAWVMDERKSERAHGVTIDIAEKQFTLNNRSFTIMDAPGHRDFVPNMIKGASFANFALLIIPATEGEYETCMKDSAQTKEHATILKALGVTHIVLSINKMDATTNGPWDQHRYEGIESEVRSFLVDSLQFANENVFALPISAITGENIQEMSSSCPAKSWYSGPTLKEILEQLPSPNAEIHKPFRGIVHNIKFTSRNELDLTVSLLQGKISLNRSIALIDYQATHCKLQVGFVKQISDMEGNELPMACGHHRVLLHIAPPKYGIIILLSNFQTF